MQFRKIKRVTGNYYLNHQCLVGGSSGGEALRTIVGSLVVEHSPSDGVSSGPVHCPASIQVILPLQIPQGQIRAGGVELHHTDAARSRRYGHHTVVLYTRDRAEIIRITFLKITIFLNVINLLGYTLF